MKERKAEHRVRARAARAAITPATRAQKAARIRLALAAMDEVRDALVVGTYVSVHSEVDTRVLIAQLLSRGSRVAVPVVTPPERMELAELESLEALRPGAHDIPEPPPPRTLLDDVDVILVPGLQFTPHGHRLGYGGGYFDRLLARTPHAFRVGLAFEEQVVDALPVEEHDEVMDVVVTDRRVLRLPPRG